MKFDVLTIFPGIFDSYFAHSLMARAQKLKLIKVAAHDLRKYTTDNHKTVDGRPYGGGVGMVMRADVVFKALQALKKKPLTPTLSRKGRGGKTRVLLMTPQGQPFTQKIAKRLAKYTRLIILSGRYEGYDERIRQMADEEISIGDYVMTGGEIPAMVIVDTVARLVPGVVGKAQSLVDESFSENLLEYPQYTRPENFRGRKAPKVLLSGNHAAIAKWRKSESLKRTKKRRPDLLKNL